MPVRSRVAFSGIFSAVSSLALLFAACGGEIEEVPSRFDPADAGHDSGVDSAIDSSADGATDRDGATDGSTEDSGAESELAPIVETNLGAVPNGSTQTFHVGPHTIGVQILAKTSTPQAVGISDIFAPDGTVVAKDFVPTKGTFETQIGAEGLSAASIPVQNLAATMPLVAEGDWKASFLDDDASPIQASVKTLQTDDGLFHGGSLDIHLWIPDGLQLSDGEKLTPVTIAGGEAQTTVKLRLDSFYELLQRTTGIGRGSVTLHPISSVYRTLDGGDGIDELTPMLQSSTSVGERRAMHFFWVESSPNLSWWGIASGIPGAAQSPGTPMAGVTLASIDSVDPAYEGMVMLHEMGHFIGLQHPSEFENVGQDPLEDTPFCSNITMLNYQNCPDATNVMFAAGSLDAPAIVVSPLQQRIFRSSFVYKALRRDPVGPTPNPLPPAPTTRAFRTYRKGFGGWTPKTPIAQLLAGGCAHQHLPQHASPADVPVLRALVQDASAPAFVRERARRLLAD